MWLQRVDLLSKYTDSPKQKKKRRKRRKRPREGKGKRKKKNDKGSHINDLPTGELKNQD